jgi:8-oxo-dGTP diphosphatase
MLTVVAAIIESDGRLLACQRRKDAAFALKWEFPGGKVKQGESPQAALARELREELGASATIGAELYRTRHKYPEMKEELELTFFEVTVNPAEISNLVFEQILWATRRELSNLDFLAADRDLIARLVSQSSDAR